MNIFIKRLKSNKGVTLSELLVGMFILAILLSAIYALFSQVTRSQKDIIDMSELNSLLDNVSNPIISDLSNAYEVLFCNPACTCDESCDPDDPAAVAACTSVCNCRCVIWGRNIDKLTMRLGGVGNIVYYIGADGSLFKNCISPLCPVADCEGHAVLHKDFYKRRSVSFLINPATDPFGTPYNPQGSFTLVIIITSDSDDSDWIRREYSIRPLTIESNQY
jgi:prepilin-type N-terminal cleavage/methylation domain-containing protein